MTDPALPAIAAVDSRVVDRDAPCRVCWYNLRGLALNGACPECSTPLSEALEPAPLRTAPLPYVRGLERAADLVRIAAMLPVFLMIGIITMLILGDYFNRELGQFQRRSEFIAIGGYFVTLLITLVGWWRLSAPDDRRAHDLAESRFRKRFRVLLAAWIGVMLVFGLRPFAPHSYDYGQLGVIGATSMGALLWLWSGHASRLVISLSHRAEHRGLRWLARWTRRITLVAILVGGVTLAAWVTWEVWLEDYRRSHDRRSMLYQWLRPMPEWLALATTLLWLFVGAMYILLTNRLWRAIRRARRDLARAAVHPTVEPFNGTNA